MSQFRYRLTDVGPDGTVWLVGSTSDGRAGDRIHVVSGALERATD